MIIHGRNVILYNNGTAFAAAKSCDLEVDCDDIETSSATDGEWKNFIAGRKEWSVRLSHLVTTLGSNISLVGQTLSLTMKANNSENITGSALVKQWKITGSVGNLAQGSFSMRGTGALTVTSLPSS